MKRNPAWIETFSVQFLGSVEVPYHQGNGILCAAMQKVREVENSHNTWAIIQSTDASVYAVYAVCTIKACSRCVFCLLDCDIEETDSTCAASFSV